MTIASFTLTDSASEQLEKIQSALGRIDGEVPARSRVIRLALATMFKRMSDEGLIVEDGK